MKTPEQFVNEECAVYTPSALADAIHKRDVQIKAATFREAARLFEDRHWAYGDLHRMATKLDGIAIDGFPVHPTPSEPPAGSTQGVPEARRFMLKLTCCGREADPPSRPMTWAEADAFRESYVSGPGVTSPERPRENGHVRSAIIVEASDVSVLETAAVAGVPEGKPDVLPEPPRRPTIAELEAILNSENPLRLVTRPDGEIRAVPMVPHCPGCDGGCDLCRANPPVEPTTGQQETLATRRESEATPPGNPSGAPADGRECVISNECINEKDCYAIGRCMRVNPPGRSPTGGTR